MATSTAELPERLDGVKAAVVGFFGAWVFASVSRATEACMAPQNACLKLATRNLPAP